MTEEQAERIIKLLEGIDLKLAILANAAPRQPGQWQTIFNPSPVALTDGAMTAKECRS